MPRQQQRWLPFWWWWWWRRSSGPQASSCSRPRWLQQQPRPRPPGHRHARGDLLLAVSLVISILVCIQLQSSWSTFPSLDGRRISTSSVGGPATDPRHTTPIQWFHHLIRGAHNKNESLSFRSLIATAILTTSSSSQVSPDDLLITTNNEDPRTAEMMAPPSLASSEHRVIRHHVLCGGCFLASVDGGNSSCGALIQHRVATKLSLSPWQVTSSLHELWPTNRKRYRQVMQEAAYGTYQQQPFSCARCNPANCR